MGVDLFSFPHCQAASQAAFSPSQLAFQGPQVLPVSGREGRRQKVDLQQLSGQSGPVGDGLWASSPVRVGQLMKAEHKNRGHLVSMEALDTDIMSKHRHLKTTVRSLIGQ